MAIDLSSAWRRLGRPEQQHRLDLRADGDLTDLERAILAFEARPWPKAGVKMTAIRDTFGWSETRYYQVLRALLDRPAALKHAPQLVHRLRAQLDARRR